MSNNYRRGNTKNLIGKLFIIRGFIVIGLLSLSPINTSYSIDVFKSASNSQSNENITNSNTTSISPQSYDRLKKCSQDQHTPTNGITYLTHFSCGHVSILKNGTTLRSFSLIAQENVSIPIANNGLNFDAWTYNGSIPGPTMRMTEGDHIQITLINSKTNKNSHSIHMHSIHDGSMDGVPGASGNSGIIKPGQSFTYSFIAQPFGVYPYHCHVDPIDLHINQGLFGMIIIDPKTPRPQMTEMVMLMNGYNLNYSGIDRIPTVEEVKKGEFPESNHANQVYTVNGVAFEYNDHPIHLLTGHPYRIYLANLLEFDPLNNFHLHGNLFNYYPSGTSLKPEYKNDMVDMMQGDRGILEFTYNFPGMFMFHAHKTEFTMKGWMGMFNVTK
ncbi:MAG: multicopper oxidase domain-containing protein, partial [Candidatus Nitrosocosmicus sp.]